MRCSAGRRIQRIKGSHAAIKSGMLCAEALCEAVLKSDRRHDELKAYPEAFEKSWLRDELNQARELLAGTEALP